MTEAGGKPRMTGIASTPDPWKPPHLKALRWARRESQAELAEAAKVSEDTLCVWESGRRPPTRPAVVRRLNALFEALTPAERERYDRELARLQEAECGGQPASGARLASTAPDACEGNTDMHRRDNLQMFAAVLAAGMTGGFRWDRLAPPTVDAGLVADYERGVDALTDVYAKGNPTVMLPAAAAFADGLAPLLLRAPTQDLGLRLSAVMVDAHIIAGVLAFDAGDAVLTHRHLAQASYVAEASMDPLLRAHAWTMLAKFVHSPLKNGPQGSARRAVALLGRAKALSRRADGLTRAFLATSFAEEAVLLGDAGLCEWAVEDAARALEGATAEPSGLFSTRGLYIGRQQYLAAMQGRVAGLAGRADEAERLQYDQIHRAANTRQRIAGLCNLGRARIYAAQPEGACEAVADAAAYARATGFAGRLVCVRAVRLAMPRTWDTLDCVADLDERLRAAA